MMGDLSDENNKGIIPRAAEAIFQKIEGGNSNTEFKISFCNSVLTTNGGTHEQGFRTGVAKSIRKIAKFKNNKLLA